MTLDAALAAHNHISEREPDGSWEDCTWDAGLEFYRLAFDASRPATHAEAQALRKASGEPTTGGSNVGDFRRGVTARYNRAIPASVAGFSALWALLLPGTVALVQGSMAAFGPAHRLSRWQTDFDGGHAVMVARLPGGGLWWCDPLATDLGYLGEAITKTELKSFVDAFNGGNIVAPIKTIEEDHVAQLTITSTEPKSIDIPVGAKALLPDGTDGGYTFTQKYTRFSPYAAGTLRAYYAQVDGKQVIRLVGGVAVRDLPAVTVVDDGFTATTQAVAVAAQKAADKAILDAHLALDPGLIAAAKAEATLAEKNRMKAVLGL